MNIVLAHGVLGFGNLLGTPDFLNYFNGVSAHLSGKGHAVVAPQVNPVGTVAQRAAELGAAIVRRFDRDARAVVIAHSMGGLDARHAISHVPGVAERVGTLVTIGTPHRGSPVADAIASRTDPLLAHIPTFLVEALQRNAGALHDLTTSFGVQLDQTTPDVESVRYIYIAGDAAKGGHELFLFQLAAVIGRLTGEINDGVVTRSSALRQGHDIAPDWPVDHAGEVGWSLESPVPIALEALTTAAVRAHLARYDAILATL